MRDFLAYLGERAIEAGHSPSPGLGPTWLLTEVEADEQSIADALDGAGDECAWVRLKRMTDFGHGGFAAMIDQVGGTVERVGARAYLVRNSVVHQGDRSRGAALSATLPAFAGVVRVALAWAARSAHRTKPLIAAGRATLDLEVLRAKLGTDRAKMLKALQPFAEPGAVAVDQVDAPTEERPRRVEEVAASD